MRNWKRTNVTHIVQMSTRIWNMNVLWPTRWPTAGWILFATERADQQNILSSMHNVSCWFWLNSVFGHFILYLHFGSAQLHALKIICFLKSIKVLTYFVMLYNKNCSHSKPLKIKILRWTVRSSYCLGSQTWWILNELDQFLSANCLPTLAHAVTNVDAFKINYLTRYNLQYQ